MKKYKFLIIIAVLMILFSFNAFAFAVTSYYWDEKPLFLDPGQSTTVQAFGLQNMAGNEDVIIKVEQVSGLEIARITDKSTLYNVPLGRKDIYVDMAVSIPLDSKIGEVYEISATFKESTDDDGAGAVRFTSGMQTSIFVVVGQRVDGVGQVIGRTEEPLPPQEEYIEPTIVEKIQDKPSLTGPAVLILIILAVILFYRHELKKKKR